MPHQRLSFRFRRRKIKEEKEDPLKELLEIYEENENEGQNLTAGAAPVQEKKEDDDSSLKILIEQSRRRQRKVFLFGAGVFFGLFAGAAVAGFLYFSGHKIFQTEKLQLEIQAPEKINIGETFEYLITYRNEGGIALINARLLLQYPKGLIIEKTEPAVENFSLAVGDVSAGETGKLKITGRLVDSPETEQRLSAKLLFEPENFNSEFSKETAHSIMLVSPEIAFALSYPANATPGQKVNIKIKLKNAGAEALENAKIAVLYSEKFQFQTSQPAASEDNQVWLVNKLAGQETSKEINIEGVFPAGLALQNNSEREQNFSIKLFCAGKNNQYFEVKEEKFLIKIIDQPVNAFLIINGTTENRNISLGDVLTFSLVIKNNGGTPLSKVKAKTVWQISGTDVFNWNKIDDKKFGKIQNVENGKEISWGPEQAGELKKIDAKKDATITFSLPIKTYPEAKELALLGQTAIEIYSAVDLSSETNNIPAIKSAPVILTLSSGANLGAKALYYYDDGTPIGSGPLPLQAEQPTKLKIFWDISNDLHEIQNINISTNLGERVDWIAEKNVSAGDIVFDEKTKQVLWKINRLPESIKEAHANFGVAVTPKPADVGQLLKLTNTTIFTAKDALTNSLITRTKNILTSALDQDKFAPGDGTVKP
jgi:hypothetical protein